MKKCLLLFFCTSFLLLFPAWTKAKEKNKDEVPPPKTVAEACARLDTILSYEDKERIREMRYDDLIELHFGLGMYIRNNFGLWAGNPELCKDLGLPVDAHPDNVSGVLLDRYWKYLNADMPELPLDGLQPEEYLKKIFFYLGRAYLSKDIRIINRLPQWVEDPAYNGKETKESGARMEAALRLIDDKTPLACVALLYAGQSEMNPKNRAMIEQYLGKSEPRIVYPMPVDEDTYFAAMLKTEDIEHIFELKAKWASRVDGRFPHDYLWKTLSIGDVALLVLNHNFSQDWKSPEEYFLWKESLKSNPYCKGCLDPLTVEEIKELKENPLTLFKFLMLAQGWVDVDQDMGNMPDRISLRTTVFFPDDPDMDARIPDSSMIRMNDDAAKKWAGIYPRELRGPIRPRVEPTPDEFECAAQKLLKKLADSVDANALLDSISLNALGDYNLNYKTPRLHDYSIFVGFVLVAEKQRLIETGRIKELSDICFYYYQQGGTAAYFDHYLVRLLFEIDPQRMQTAVRTIFDPTRKPSDAGFTETALLQGMIGVRFEEYQKVVEQRFWRMQQTNLGAHPSERAVILSQLKSTSDATRKLYDKIRADRRFKPQKDDP